MAGRRHDLLPVQRPLRTRREAAGTGSERMVTRIPSPARTRTLASPPPANHLTTRRPGPPAKEHPPASPSPRGRHPTRLTEEHVPHHTNHTNHTNRVRLDAAW